MSEVERSRLKRAVAKSAVTKSANRIQEVIAEKGSVLKVRQFASIIKEAKNNDRNLTKILEDLDPESTENDGSWLGHLEFNVSEIVGEVSDYLVPKSKVEPLVFQARSLSENEAASSSVLLGEPSYSKGIPTPTYCYLCEFQESL